MKLSKYIVWECVTEVTHRYFVMNTEVRKTHSVWNDRHKALTTAADLNRVTDIQESAKAAAQAAIQGITPSKA